MSSFVVVAIDDDPLIHRLVGAILRDHDVELVSAQRGDEGIQAVLSRAVDLVLLDFELPDRNGLEVLKELHDACPRLPVIMATGSDDALLLGACFEAGAVDYVRKPFVPHELRARVASALERRRMTAELERLVYRDPLTDLLNRRAVLETLQAAIAEQRGAPGLLYLDFDRFKLINDGLGHDVGDALLTAIAERLVALSCSGEFPAFDTGRIGGDEFVVVVASTATDDEMLALGQRILHELGQPFDLLGHEVTSSASIGLLSAGRCYRDAAEMVRDADTAMYEAKRGGRGRCVAFDPTMQQAVADRIRLEADLREGIGRDELRLHFQPIVCLESGRTAGMEALVRWEHPERGLLSPGAFIPLAEETGLVVPLGEWVLEEACRTMAAWRRELSALACPKTMHVNLARQQLMQVDIVERVRCCLARHGLPPDALHLEVTETEMMSDADAATEVLGRLADLGVQVAMDDFGTGYSSLSCLYRFPLHVLKVDRSFVARMMESRALRAMLHAVCNLAHNLSLSVVAEGIETQDQLATLQSLDCDTGQGYLFAKPLPGDEAKRWLEARERVHGGPPLELTGS